MNNFSGTVARIIILCAAAVSMTGCADGERALGDGAIAVLDRAQTDADVFPPHVALDDIDDESLRLVAEKDGVSYFIARQDSADGNGGYCLAAVNPSEDSAWGAWCGSGPLQPGQIVTGSVLGIPGESTLVTDDFSTTELEAEGWVSIHQNVLVRSAT